MLTHTYPLQRYIILFNKKKLLDLINKTPELHCTRTLYGNTYKIGGTKHSDVKVFDSNPDFDYKQSALLSTDDAVINTNNMIWSYIKRSFPNKSEFELF